jgi:hypothetical protein
VLWKSDTTSNAGTATVYGYDTGGHVTLQTFDTLAPTSASLPVAAETLAYAGALLREVRAWQAGDGAVDSLFGYDAKGRLVSMRRHGGSDSILDTLVYDDFSLRSSLRYVSGKLRDSILFAYPAAQERDDSVFSAGAQAMALVRVIVNRYRNDSLLVDRRVFVNQNGMSPFSREKIVYNGLGLHAYRQVFTDGGAPTLDETDSYGYDDSGRLASLLAKDEVTGNLLFAAYYQYEAAPAAKRSAQALPSFRPADALSSLRFDLAGWKPAKPMKSRR